MEDGLFNVRIKMTPFILFSTAFTLLIATFQLIAEPYAKVDESSQQLHNKGKRFIPVELFTGAEWDGKHELKLNNVSTTTCASADGKQCDKYHIKGPFKTKENNTKIAWAGDQLTYYLRTFSIPSRGEVISHFTINNSKDGLVRIYDKRERWGERSYSGLSSKFPLGYWQQGEVRHYGTKKPVRIEILELSDEKGCLTFRWTLGKYKGKNSDNNYTFCPNKGLVIISHNKLHNNG